MGWKRLKGTLSAAPPESAVRVLPNGVVYVPVETVYYRGRLAKSSGEKEHGNAAPRSRDREKSDKAGLPPRTANE